MNGRNFYPLAIVLSEGDNVGKLMREAKKERERLDEWLSAYLDGQLSEKERAQLEARLASDERLQSELRALRRTVAMVRDLPRLPVPRNFILPQTMAGAKRPVAAVRSRAASFAPWLKAAAALVGVFAVVTFASMLIYLAGSRPAATPPPREPAPVEVTVVVERTALLKESEAMPEALPQATEEAQMLLAAPQATGAPLPVPKVPEAPPTVAGAPVTLLTATPSAREEQPMYDTGEAEKRFEYTTEHETTPVSERVSLLPWIVVGTGGVILALVVIFRLRRR